MNPVMQALVGTWFVCSTTFPMWLKGNKTNPTFTYTPIRFKEQPVLLDQVRYDQKGKRRTLTGYDFPDTTRASAFEWRGKGLLGLVHSNWQVRLRDPNGEWAVIWFSKTLFTPEGIDIISRQPRLSAEALAHIQALMQVDQQLAPLLSQLRALPGSPGG